MAPGMAPSRQTTKPLRHRPQTLFATGLALLLLFYAACYHTEATIIRQHFGAVLWWTHTDQGYYDRDVLAWRAKNLDPSQHYYFPGYALAALPFAALTPSNPFLAPDALSFAATIILLALWARRLLPRNPWLPGLVPWLMLLLWVWRPQSLQVWLDPWDTTPTVPLGLWCLLAAQRFGQAPSARNAFAAGLSAGLIAIIRPIDALIFAVPAAIRAALALPRLPPPKTLALTATATAGAACAIAPGAAAYLLTQGFHHSAYWRLSSQIGFDWHLIAWRWVAIMLPETSPAGGAAGLIAHYPWIITGLAGLLAGLLRPASQDALAASALLGAAATLQFLVYLSYRDLQPTGLFAYGNQHYFTFAVAVLAMTTLVLIENLIASPASRRAAIAALCLASLTLPWRITFIKNPTAIVTATPSLLYLSGGLPTRATVLFAAPCPVDSHAALQTVTLTIAGHPQRQLSNFKPFAFTNGFLLLSCSERPPGRATTTAACGPAPTPPSSASILETMRIAPNL